MAENEAMKSRLGTRTRRQSASSSLAGADAGDRRQVAGHERQHAGGEERDEPGAEGDRNAGAARSGPSAWPHRAAQRLVERRREAAAVLAGERVVGAELGEDRDHHAADQVAALGVGLGRRSPPGARSSAVSRSPSSQAANARAERASVPSSSASASSTRAARPSARKSPAKRLEQRRAPPRCSPRASSSRAELRRRLGRGAGRARAPGAAMPRRRLGQPVGLGGHELVEERLDLGRRDRAGELGDDLAVAEGLDRGNPADVEALRRAPGWRRRRPWPARSRRRAWRPPPRARGRAGGTGRTTRPRSRRPPGPRASARRRRSMKSASLTSLIMRHASRLASRQPRPTLSERHDMVMDDSLRGKLLVASPALGRPELRAHGGADHRAQRRRRDGSRAQPARRRPRSARSRRSSARSPRASRSSSAARCSRRRWSCSPSSTTPTAAAWIVVADVGFVAAETEHRRPRARGPPRPRLRRLLGLGRGPARGRARRGGVDRRAAAAGRAVPRRSRAAVARRARAQGRPVRADRPDARRPLAMN